MFVFAIVNVCVAFARITGVCSSSGTISRASISASPGWSVWIEVSGFGVRRLDRIAKALHHLAVLRDRAGEDERDAGRRVGRNGEAVRDARDDAALRGIAERLERDVDLAFGGEQGRGEKEQRNQRTFHPAILHVPRGHGDRICGCCMALPPLRYRAVLFDLDGTLVDSYAALAEAVNFARREHGLHELSAARIRDFVGDGLDTMLLPRVRRRRRAAQREGRVRIALRRDLLRGVDDPRRRRVDARHAARPRRGHGGLHEQADVVLEKDPDVPRSSRRTSAPSSDPTLPARASRKRSTCCTRWRRRRALPSEALFVGDMPIDVHAARNSGMDVAVVSTGSSTPEALQRGAARITIWSGSRIW